MLQGQGQVINYSMLPLLHRYDLLPSDKNTSFICTHQYPLIITYVNNQFDNHSSHSAVPSTEHSSLQSLLLLYLPTLRP